MAERKVLNKYYPSDFDPAKIRRRRMPKNQQIKVRMMLPMSIRCSTCGNYIYRGTKFNSRKEDVIQERYLGFQIFRFYVKCTTCSSEITVKTDPQNSDYIVESGAARTFEPWRAGAEEEQQRRDVKQMEDPMKSSENRRLISYREMKILSNLDKIKSMKSKHEFVNLDAMFEALQQSAPVQDKLQGEDQVLIKSIFQRSRELKKRRVCQEVPDNPAVYFTKTTTDNTLNKREDPRGLGSFVFKSSTVKFSVLKKPSEASSLKTQANAKEQEDDKGKSTSNALRSLCHQYYSDEEE